MVLKAILILVVLNTITNTYFIYKMAAKAWNLSFSWRETHWLRRRYGLDIYQWTHPVGADVGLNEAVSVFGFNFGSPVQAKGDYEIYCKRKRRTSTAKPEQP